MSEYDVIIVGAGPAGMSAALFAQGDDLNFRLLEQDRPCRFVEETVNTNFTNLENYLGLYGLQGTQVQRVFREHLESRKIPIEINSVRNIRVEEDILILNTNTDEVASRTVILATGTSPKEITVPGAEGIRRRIHYMVNEELAKEYHGKEVLIVGGRNSGVVTAIKLKELGCSPIVIEKNNMSAAKSKYMTRLSELRIPYLVNSRLEKIVGDRDIEKIELRIGESMHVLKPAAIVGCIGYKPNNKLALSLGLVTDEEGYVTVNRRMQTSDERVFAVGDLNGGVKMIIVAAGEGATAEYYANSLARSKWKKR